MLGAGQARNILLWHVHGSWTQAFVAGRHRYLIPVVADRGHDGIGLAGRAWPNAREVALEDLGCHDVDLVVLQRPEEAALFARWAGRPAVARGPDARTSPRPGGGTRSPAGGCTCTPPAGLRWAFRSSRRCSSACRWWPSAPRWPPSWCRARPASSAPTSPRWAADCAT